MSETFEAATARIESLCERVVVPAVISASAPLAAEVVQSSDPLPFAAAVAASYRTVRIGWRWGPVWSNAWFRLRGTVPREMAGSDVFLRFSSGTEALFWDAGVPRHGLDLNHDLAPVLAGARGGEDLVLHVEAACNRPLGATTFFWDDAAEVERWKEELPGRLERCELVTIDREVWRLKNALVFAARLLKLFPAGAERGQRLERELLAVTAAVEADGPRRAAPAALASLAEALAPEHRETPDPRTICHAVGHAHIDTAWLWTLREGRRKCLRTFSTAVELIDRHPGFNFLCSQAQQYAWVEQDSPMLFARIRERVAAGRWEPGGAMWVEPDANLPSGESLIRQVLHAMRYWRERFGAAGGHRYLFLPDTFGFPASLPQIMTQCGLGTFITNKLGWNETNEFPHSTFLWRGIDGTEVLSHCTPGLEYNSTMTPAELRKGGLNHIRKDAGRTGVWLQPFGYGDGGGGPTDWMIHEAELAADCEGMPRVKLSRVGAFCEDLHDRLKRLQARGGSLPVWDGELYLERHRGTYTTQAWIKRANREAEEQLRTAEWLKFAGPRPPTREERLRTTAALDDAWKTVLLHQFHDILPGSSIGAVYAEAKEHFARASDLVRPRLDAALATWGFRKGGPSCLALNPASSPRRGVVDVDGVPAYVPYVPAMGVAAVRGEAPAGLKPVAIHGLTLTNGLIEAAIDEAGQVRSLRQLGERGGARPELHLAPLNQLVLYDDRPQYWDAWDIDEDYLNHPHPIDGQETQVTVLESGPLRAAIRVARTLSGGSELAQTFVLGAGSPCLDVRTSVTWREQHKLLRVLAPTTIAAHDATYGIQFGHIRRPTHQDDSRAKAKFEVCAHRWMDLSEPGRGLAILSESKYGHSCRGGVMGLSLLRSTKFPDPDADMGEHHFTYSLMPHAADWRAAGVDVEAEALNRPMRVFPGVAAWPGGGSSWAPLTLLVLDNALARIEIVALKPAEDGGRLIVRLVETRGLSARVRIDWGFPVGRVESVNLVERPRPSVMLSNDPAAGPSGRTELTFKPFEIISLAVERR